MGTVPALSYSPEDQLLLCAAHPHLSPERRERLASLLATPLDWEVLLRRLNSHGIGPLLFHHLKKMSEVALPETARVELERQALTCRTRNLLLQHAQIRLLDAFNQAGIDVMPLKGLYLAQLLYVHPSLRVASDIDLLVRQSDLEKATQILLDAGGIRRRSSEQETDLYERSFSMGRGDKRGFFVELHWALTWEHISGLTIREIWRSASQEVWQGQDIYTMALPDLLLYLCLHTAKDGLAKVRFLLDINLLVERFGQQLPWDELAEKVKMLQIKGPVFLCLEHCRVLLDAPIPETFLIAIHPPRGVSWFLGQAFFRWRGGVLHTPPARLRGPLLPLFRLLLEDSLQGKLRHLKRALMPSSNLRARWLSTSSSLPVVLWYPLWIFRIIQKLVKLSITRTGGGY